MDMLSCNLNRSIDVPLYEQLYLYIKKEITEGRLEYGSKLPSKRKLADFLKISQNTVEAAYDQLMAEGYVEGIPRKGYFVLAYEDLEYVQTAAATSYVPTDEKENMKYHFLPSRIDTKHFPFAKWRKYAKDTIDEQHHALLLLGDKQGEFELRREIAHYLYHARGVQCSPEQIVVGAGSDFLLQQLILLFPKKTVYGVEDPGYHVISHILKSHQNEVYPLEVDDEGVKVDTLDQTGINVVYVTPSHHFPYGSVLSVNRRIKLLNWAAGHANRYIIEDDYDSEFRYSGKSIPSLQSMDHSEKVIYLGSFSKSLIPSLRISYMVLPQELLQRYKDANIFFYHCSVSRIDQHILAQFMKKGDFERHLNRMRKIYRKKLEKTLDILKPYQNKVEVIGEHSGLHIVLVVKNGMNEQDLVQKAVNAKMKIHPLSSYSLEKKVEHPPKMILGFAGIPEDELEAAITSLLKSWGIS
ncbi:GntR family transcriptional regulator/MocR family aminotransferase [Bacillus thermophilus]|uniref:GntR family transcriptional regulator/MocR family aminotransferase n=1 Tax=Siminovitchia thermophila TaxID=1245522 RepID=A0ABS2R4R7_9BACI|nr:PLP-dependent aminotransferase family protein [Siminovitchia thermophila]MBM7714606.1 GntR family transcriptional regulator/MocR family aminotransferase [Siminovitchia thermophila]ONK22655.1 GntR family transcriptional regulator [Bacillus sp. VT-16-64]